MTFLTFMLVGLGGALGAICRARLITIIEGYKKHWLFRGAFFVNCVSCLIAGACLALAVGPVPQAVIMAGFCGGFSTLSAVNLDAACYLFDGSPRRCFSYLGLTYAGAFLFAGLGFAMVRVFI